MPARNDRHTATLLSLRWPSEYPDAGTHFWANQLLSGFRAVGMRIEKSAIPLPGSRAMLLVEVSDGEQAHLIAFDDGDSPEIEQDIAENVLVYFKLQYGREGYAQSNVVPGGYVLAHNRAYRYLPLLRTIRSARFFKYDVYGRFGLRYGGSVRRRRAHELLSARDDFHHEVSLFKYPGGPEKVPYREYLFEIPRAKVCVDMPGGGDLCTRLLDYLAIGSCVVGPPPTVRLPIKLIDGEHIVYCASDLADLGEMCSQLVRDDQERERIARNAREFFDRYLHRRQLATYYISKVEDVHQGWLAPDTARIGRPWWRQRRGTRLKRAAAAVFAAVMLLEA